MSVVYPHQGAPRLHAHQVNQAATGRWLVVLVALGLPESVLTKRNKPCPGCGGRDRFSFIDDGRGAFVCRGMDRQGGDGLTLLMHVFGWDFKRALLEVAQVLGLPESAAVAQDTPRPVLLNRPSYETPPPTSATNEGAVAQLWSGGRVLTGCEPAALYLKGRGLTVPVTEALRCQRLTPYWHSVTSPQYPDGKPQLLGRYPALLAKVSGPDGALVGVHITYVTAAGQKLRLIDPALCTTHGPATLPAKKLRTVREGVMRGAAIRLFAPDANGRNDSGKRLAVAEGTETALAVYMLSGLPVWACVSAFGLEHLIWPVDVTDLWVFADNDASGTGQEAGRRLLRRAQDAGLRVRYLVPPTVGSDWLDVLTTSTTASPAPLSQCAPLVSNPLVSLPHDRH